MAVPFFSLCDIIVYIVYMLRYITACLIRAAGVPCLFYHRHRLH